ncbi:hypothetical protein GJW-30_1_01222 [Variibacter gotjawalensis]|uniref:Uncharacterized protein n=1 Tax=Variibacter gotjawalensis TaxID=1333996 RepID=A0A0S3PRX0_9BRAD|nr:hypothetical protein [Variibacter gotjawalensis]NIK49005.1 hypothetical protein [Variibacter gotjawalensis]RZS50861.1 hypothetical protein EV661_3332 [Variibacter gotjawalensis]BAT58695.1 hypothetical protein GJW-30_1_01222 [Variibacter gotjawalensis]
MLRIALALLPFVLGAVIGAFAISRGAYRRYWSLVVVSAAVGTLPGLRLVDGAFGSHLAETLRVTLSNTARCADIGCGFVGNIAYVVALGALFFAAGLSAGGFFARGSHRVSQV